VALVGVGAEELKDEILTGLAQSNPELMKRLAAADLNVPVVGTNACQLGAAVYAAGREGR